MVGKMRGWADKAAENSLPPRTVTRLIDRLLAHRRLVLKRTFEDAADDRDDDELRGECPRERRCDDRWFGDVGEAQPFDEVETRESRDECGEDRFVADATIFLDFECEDDSADRHAEEASERSRDRGDEQHLACLWRWLEDARKPIGHARGDLNAGALATG